MQSKFDNIGYSNIIFAKLLNGMQVHTYLKCEAAMPNHIASINMNVEKKTNIAINFNI